MIIIDVDCIKNAAAKKMVRAMVSSKLRPFKDAKGKVFLEPTEAIVWYSEKKLNIKSLPKMGLPKVGECFYGGNLAEFMGKMIADINAVSEKNGMGKFTKFHSTQVVSDNHLAIAKDLGATPFPISFFCGRKQ